MHFLLNDTVLLLGGDSPKAPPALSAVSMDVVTQLGAELFAQNPGLHRNEIRKAERLATLILSRSPQINAARFAAPSVGCPVGAVAINYASISIEVMGSLARRQNDGALTLESVNDMIWSRIAA